MEKCFEETGKRLKSIRAELGLTMTRLGEEAGISRKSISAFERGRRLPGVRYLKLLVEKYNVNLSYLLGESEPMFRDSGKELLDLVLSISDSKARDLLCYMCTESHVREVLLKRYRAYKSTAGEIIEK